MAVAPLFAADMNALKSQLRLSGAVQADALSQIDSAVQQVRMGFYDALGPTRVAAIIAMPYSENPSTADGVMRLRANIAEKNWVKYLLLRVLPMEFIDGSNQVQQTWNEEGLARAMNAAAIDKELTRLWAEVEASLKDLAGAAAPDSTSILSVMTPEADCKPLRLGKDIRLFRPNLRGAAFW